MYNNFITFSIAFIKITVGNESFFRYIIAMYVCILGLLKKSFALSNTEDKAVRKDMGSTKIGYKSYIAITSLISNFQIFRSSIIVIIISMQQRARGILRIANRLVNFGNLYSNNGPTKQFVNHYNCS